MVISLLFVLLGKKEVYINPNRHLYKEVTLYFVLLPAVFFTQSQSLSMHTILAFNKLKIFFFQIYTFKHFFAENSNLTLKQTKLSFGILIQTSNRVQYDHSDDMNMTTIFNSLVFSLEVLISTPWVCLSGSWKTLIKKITSPFTGLSV